MSQGTRDIGVRLALGATSRRILRMVMQQGAAIVALGLVTGIVGSLALGSFLRKLLFGVTATDPVTYAIVSIVLVLVALLGTFVPARRAAAVDPVAALRGD